MFDPFVTPPLKQIPFNSRIDAQYSSTFNNNYFALGFNPGYALQASELNELQELFALNTNLTQRMNSIWGSFGYKLPFWEGLIPLSPQQIQIVDNGIVGNIVSFTVTVQNGWYLWTDPDSRMSHWIYMNQDATETTEKIFSAPVNSPSVYIGYVLTKETILCCPDSTCSETEDDTLRDNSDGSTVGQANTCGASRLKISFSNDSNDFESRTSFQTNSTFRTLFYINPALDSKAYFLNLQELPISRPG